MDVVFRGRCVLPDGERHAAVGVRDGVIVWVEPSGGETRREVVSRARDESAVIDLANDEVLLPGLVDTHVHVNEPGRTDWEGFASATRAAAAGGVTTIIDMPLNSIPPTIDSEALATKQLATEGQRFVDVGFWGGAVPSSLGTLETLYQQGVFGFKCFLLPSGVEEFPPLDRAGLDSAMREIAGFDGLLIVHAEDAATIDRAPAFAGRSYADFLRSRPPEAEDRAIAEVLELAAQHGTRVHILHLSSAPSLSRLALARDAGVRVTVETCPHYLTLAAEGIEDGATEFKCCPPIRDTANQDGLWQGLRDSVVDCVVSDHSPAPPALKDFATGDFSAAWGGVSSLQLGLSLVWTHASYRGLGVADVVRWMSTAPTRVAGVAGKGAIAEGHDADLVVFGPEETFEVDPDRLHHKHNITPYAGRELRGVVRQTWLAGELVARRGAVKDPPIGRLLARGGGSIHA